MCKTLLDTSSPAFKCIWVAGVGMEKRSDALEAEQRALAETVPPALATHAIWTALALVAACFGCYAEL